MVEDGVMSFLGLFLGVTGASGAFHGGIRGFRGVPDVFQGFKGVSEAFQAFQNPLKHYEDFKGLSRSVAGALRGFHERSSSF